MDVHHLLYSSTVTDFRGCGKSSGSFRLVHSDMAPCGLANCNQGLRASTDIAYLLCHDPGTLKALALAVQSALSRRRARDGPTSTLKPIQLSFSPVALASFWTYVTFFRRYWRWELRIMQPGRTARAACLTPERLAGNARRPRRQSWWWAVIRVLWSRCNFPRRRRLLRYRELPQYNRNSHLNNGKRRVKSHLCSCWEVDFPSFLHQIDRSA